jgi:hypothetical protein
MSALALQRAARQNWREGKFADAQKLYQAAADKCRGFARKVNLECACDCEMRKPFNGTPKE